MAFPVFRAFKSSTNVATALPGPANDYGLHVLAEGPDQPEAYIVAIHGLTGHRINTWRHEDGTMWLQDLLPDRLPTTRVLTFGYDADILTRTRADLEDVASTLLSELNSDNDDQGSNAPIFFICHSLGGVVFKKAIVMAYQRPQYYERVLERTKGVVFLGVPHAGSDIAAWTSALDIVRAVTLRGVDHNKHFLAGLKANSPEFAQIARAFVDRSKYLTIKTFYETRAMGFGSAGVVVVGKESAIIGLPTEETIGVYADHVSLPKLCATEKAITGTVVRMVKREIELQHRRQEENVFPLDEEDKAIVQSLYLPGDDMLPRISSPAPGTCEWIFGNKLYSKWAHSKQNANLLWIESPPGLGKTVLARYLVEQYQKREDSVTLYFFCDSGIDDRTHGTSILRSILHQLLSRKLVLIQHARQEYRTHGKAWVASLKSLSDVLKKCMNDSCLGKALIVVDALDECKDIDNRDHLEWVQAMLKGNPTNQTSLKVILTSRPNSTILEHFRQSTILLRLDDQSAESRGLGRFIEEEVSHSAASISPEDKLWLTQTLKNHCEGSFLWVSKTTEGISRMTWPTRGTMEDALKTPPSDLSAMYGRILDEASKQDLDEVKFLLQVIVAAYSPLSTDELNWISAAHQSKGNLERIRDFVVPNFENKIRSLCGGLVSVTHGKASLCHKTFRDFLTGKLKHNDVDHSRFQFSESAAQLKLAEVCVWGLTAIGQKSRLDNEFAVYTIIYGARHIKEIEGAASTELFDRLKGLYENDNICKIWRQCFCAMTKAVAEEKLRRALRLLFNSSGISQGTTQKQFDATIDILVGHEQLDQNASPVRMASFFGHVRIFRALLEADSSRYNAQFEDGWTALCTAVHQGQVEMVEYILEHGGDLEPQSRGSSALHYASRQPDANMVNILLRRNAPVDVEDSSGRTPLAIAAARGNEMVVKALLTENADINHADSEGTTPLHEASKKGHAGVVLMILEVNDDLKQQNSKGQTPFELAAEQGRTDVCRIFLHRVDRDDIENNHKDVLHAATRSNTAGIIRMLLDTGMSIGTKDGHGFTAFAYAKPSCELNILESFLDGGANASEQGPNGRTLLHNAAAMDNVATVKLLLVRGVDVKQATARNDTPLHCAVAGRGHKDMFQILLDHGAELESRNSDGYTPFHTAVASWRSQTTLRILMELGADIEAKCGNGETPLQTAVRNQNAGLVRCLVVTNANADVNTSEGYSVHDLAELSFLRHIVDYRVKKNVMSVPYQIFRATADSGNEFDDNLFQTATGTVGQVALEKIEHIRESLRIKLPKGHNIQDVRLEPCLRDSSSPARAEPEFVINIVSRS